MDDRAPNVTVRSEVPQKTATKTPKCDDNDLIFFVLADAPVGVDESTDAAVGSGDGELGAAEVVGDGFVDGDGGGFIEDMEGVDDFHVVIDDLMAEADVELVDEMKVMIFEAGVAMDADENEAGVADSDAAVAPPASAEDRELAELVAVYTNPTLPVGYDYHFDVSFLSKPPLLIGALSIVSDSVKVTCKLPDHARCSAWFSHAIGTFRDAERAAKVWIARGHAYGMSRDEHLDEARRVKRPLENLWRNRAPAPGAASSSGDGMLS